MLRELLLSFVATVFDAAPWMVIGFLIAGFVNVFISKQALMRCLGGRGLWPMVRSILVGLALPICSCGVVPIAVGLHRRGVPVGSTLAFLISAPAMSPATAFTMWVLLGPRLAASYMLSVIGTALIVGLLANVLFPNKEQASGGALEAGEEKEPFLITGFSKESLGRMFRFAFQEYGSEVSFDILFGLLLATLALGLIPAHWIGHYLGASGPLTYLIIAAIASPLYVCTLPSIPVVRNLIAAGMVPGAAVTYLMGGSATNYGEIRAIARQMSRPVAYFFLGSVMLAALISGLLVDRLGFHAGPGSHEAMRKFLPLLMRPEAEGIETMGLWDWLWSGGGTAVLLYSLVWGAYHHAVKIWNNPCQVCAFWAGSFRVKEFKVCIKPCWVVRVVTTLRLAFGFRAIRGGQPKPSRAVG